MAVQWRTAQLETVVDCKNPIVIPRAFQTSTQTSEVLFRLASDLEAGVSHLPPASPISSARMEIGSGRLRKGTSSPRSPTAPGFSVNMGHSGIGECKVVCVIAFTPTPVQTLLGRSLLLPAHFSDLSRSDDFSCRKKGLDMVVLLFHVPNPVLVVWENSLVCLGIVMFAILSPLGGSPD